MCPEQAKYSELDEKLFEMQALFDLSKALNSTLNLKEILDTILLTPMGKFLISKGLVLIAKGGEHRYVVESQKGLSRSLQGQVIQLGDLPCEILPVRQIQDPLSQAFFSKNGIDVILPIMHQEQRLGIICFGKKINGKPFTDPELDYLSSLSNIAATAIQNGLMYRELAEAKRLLEKKYQEQNTLFEIERELSSSLSSLQSDKVLNLLAYSIMGEMMVQKCMIFLNDHSKLALYLNKGFDSAQTGDILSDEAFLNRLMQVREPLLVEEIAEDADVCRKCREAGIEVLVPMRSANESRGILALGPKITQLPFAREDLEFLSTLGNLSMISIENVRLFEERLKNQKFEEELRIASDIQKRLLPGSCPKLDGFDIAAINLSSRQVGGDYYDCIQLDERRYALSIADVSGKGVPASLLMSNLQASFHALVKTGLEPGEMTARINNLIHRNTDFDKFITFFFGILDIKDRTFTSVNAGHNPPYVFHDDGTFQTLNEGGLILGMMPDVIYNSETVQLQSGDCLVMFTDGVSEAMNALEEEFEEKRIEQCILENYHLGAQELLEKLIASVMEFAQGQPQADDITCFIVKVS